MSVGNFKEGDSMHQETKDILLLGQLSCFLSFGWLDAKQACNRHTKERNRWWLTTRSAATTLDLRKL